MSEEEKGSRISVTFPKNDADLLQNQVDKGEYTSLAEVVRMCVRTTRTGEKGLSIGPHGLNIPTEVAVEAIRKPEIMQNILGFIEGQVSDNKKNNAR